MKRPAVLLKLLLRAPKLRRELQKVIYSDSKQGTIVFNTLGTFIDDISPEFYFAFLLAKAGLKVKILLDDFTFDHWDHHQDLGGGDEWKRHRELKNRTFRTAYHWLARGVFCHPNIEVIPYSKALREVPEEIPLNDGDLGHAVDSMMRFFQTGEMDLTVPAQKSYYDACVRNCKISKRIGAFIDRKIKPRFILNSHGCYSIFGPVYDYLTAKGYTYLIYGYQVYKGGEAFIHDSTPRFMSESPRWTRFKDRKLTSDERAKIEGYFNNRIAGQTMDTKIYYQGVKDSGELKIDTGKAKVTFGLFPNVIWDCNYSTRYRAFKGPVEWIVKTIRFIEKNPDYHLIVRCHPSESTIDKHSKKLEAIIRQHVPNLSEIANVTVIPSDNRVKSYNLVREHVDIGLVYDGVLGLELPAMGVPVVVSGLSRYQSAGNAFEPANEKEYFELLSNPARVSADFEARACREKALLFGYFYFFETAFPVPVLSRKVFGYLDYDVTAEELDPARSPNARRLVDHLLSFLAQEKNKVTHVQA